MQDKAKGAVIIQPGTPHSSQMFSNVYKHVPEKRMHSWLVIVELFSEYASHWGFYLKTGIAAFM